MLFLPIIQSSLKWYYVSISPSRSIYPSHSTLYLHTCSIVSVRICDNNFSGKSGIYKSWSDSCSCRCSLLIESTSACIECETIRCWSINYPSIIRICIQNISSTSDSMTWRGSCSYTDTIIIESIPAIMSISRVNLPIGISDVRNSFDSFSCYSNRFYSIRGSISHFDRAIIECIGSQNSESQYKHDNHSFYYTCCLFWILHGDKELWNIGVFYMDFVILQIFLTLFEKKLFFCMMGAIYNFSMKSYQTFYFEHIDYDFEQHVACFSYSFDEEVFFEEKIYFGDAWFDMRGGLDEEVIQNILFHIHIALWVSYYKLYIPQKLVVKSGYIDEYQKNFWKKFYLNWLGEFFYTNQIDPADLLQFSSISQKTCLKKAFSSSEKYLVPIWWWKDSIVTIEMLQQFQKQIDLVTFASKDNILYQKTQEISWKKRIFIRRELSLNILKETQRWAYNWHVPISWIIAFILQMVAYLYDYRYIVLSNEFSANFWNTIWKWVSINHQWSKSFDFEKDFWEYVERYITWNVVYFSLLRPFFELHIAKIFSQVGKKYFWNFSSCNTNFKVFNIWKEFQGQPNFWCNSCPKCAFVYSILRPFLTADEVMKIFWKELFDERSLETTFRELLGISGIKPFECVWTNEEVVLALYLSVKKFPQKPPFVLEIFQNQVQSKMTSDDFAALEKKIFHLYFEDTLIPEFLQNDLKKLWK